MVLLWPWSHFPSWKPHLNLLSPLLHSKRQVVFPVPSLTPFQVLSLSYQIHLSPPPTRHYQLFLPSETVFYVNIIPLSPFFSSIYPATSQFHECSPLLALPFSLSCHSWASLPSFWLQAFLNNLPYWVFSYWLSPIRPKLNSGSSSQTYSFRPLVSQVLVSYITIWPDAWVSNTRGSSSSLPTLPPLHLRIIKVLSSPSSINLSWIIPSVHCSLGYHLSLEGRPWFKLFQPPLSWLSWPRPSSPPSSTQLPEF